MQLEDNLLDEIAEILVVDSSDVADPAVCVGLLSFFAQREGKGAVYIWKDHFSVIVLLIFLKLHSAANMMGGKLIIISKSKLNLRID